MSDNRIIFNNEKLSQNEDLMSFKSFKPSQGVRIYPNPISDEHTLIVDIKDENYLSLHLFSNDGRVIRSIQLNGDSKRIELRSEDLISGVNFIVLKRTDGSAYVEKIIKN